MDPKPMLKLRRESLEWRRVEGEIAALDLEASVYLGVNPTGTVLWEALAEGATRQELEERLRGSFNIDAEELRATRLELQLSLAQPNIHQRSNTPGQDPARGQRALRARFWRRALAIARRLRHLDATTLRAFLWGKRAARKARAHVKQGQISHGALPGVPPLPSSARRGVEAALRRGSHSCLVRANVLQAWEATHGEYRDLIIGVAVNEGFRAHA